MLKTTFGILIGIMMLSHTASAQSIPEPTLYNRADSVVFETLLGVASYGWLQNPPPYGGSRASQYTGVLINWRRDDPFGKVNNESGGDYTPRDSVSRHDNQNDIRFLQHLYWFKHRHNGDPFFDAAIARARPLVKERYKSISSVKGWMYHVLMRLYEYTDTPEDKAFWMSQMIRWGSNVMNEVDHNVGIYYQTDMGNCDCGSKTIYLDTAYRVDHQVEAGAALVDAGTRLNQPLWVETGYRQVKTAYEHAFSEEYGFFGRIYLMGSKGYKKNDDGTKTNYDFSQYHNKLWDGQAKLGEISEEIDALIRAAEVTTVDSIRTLFLEIAEKMLNALRVQSLRDHTRGGFYQAMYVSSNSTQGWVKGTAAVTQKEMRQASLLGTYYVANKLIPGNKWADMEQEMYNLVTRTNEQTPRGMLLADKAKKPGTPAIVNGYRGSVMGYTFQMEPDWSVYNNKGLLCDWISNESNSLALLGLQQYLTPITADTTKGVLVDTDTAIPAPTFAYSFDNLTAGNLANAATVSGTTGSPALKAESDGTNYVTVVKGLKPGSKALKLNVNSAASKGFLWADFTNTTGLFKNLPMSFSALIANNSDTPNAEDACPFLLSGHGSGNDLTLSPMSVTFSKEQITMRVNQGGNTPQKASLVQKYAGLSAKEWQHIVVVLSEGSNSRELTATIYCNGVLTAMIPVSNDTSSVACSNSIPCLNPLTRTPERLEVGRLIRYVDKSTASGNVKGNIAPYAGLLDEVKLFSGVELSPMQVATLYKRDVGVYALLPSNFRVTESVSGAIAATWTPSININVTGYKIYAQPTDGSMPAQELTTVGGRASNTTVLPSCMNKAYRVWIKNYSSALSQVSSDSVSYAITFTSQPAVPAPLAVAAVAENKSAIITWLKPMVAGITGFKIFREGASDVEIATVPYASEPAYTVTGLTNGVQYSFYLKAYSTSETSTASNSATVTPQYPAPVIVSVDSFPSKATISWKENSTSTGSYDVSVLPQAGSVTIDAAAKQAIIRGLTNGTRYTFSIAARSASMSNSSAVATCKATPLPLPAVTNLSKVEGDRTVQLAWTLYSSSNTMASKITSIVVKQNGVRIATLSRTAVLYTVSGLTNGTAYTYTVETTDGESTTPSTSVVATPQQQALQPPVIQLVEKGVKSAVLTWAPSTSLGMLQYRIYIKNSEGTYVLHNNVSFIGNTGATVWGLTEASYTIAVRTYDYLLNIESVNSNEVTVTFAQATSVKQNRTTKLSAYPNPVTATLQLDLTGVQGSSDVYVYTLSGSIALSAGKHSGLAQINITSLQSGNYIVVAFTPNGKFLTTNIVKQ